MDDPVVTLDHLVNRGVVIKGHNEILEGDNETLKGQVTTLEGRVGNLTAENEGLKGTIVVFKGTVVKLESDNDVERRYRACTEIVFGIQDINSVSELENDAFVVRKGLSSTFSKLRKSRQDAAHLFLYDDLPDTLL